MKNIQKEINIYNMNDEELFSIPQFSNLCYNLLDSCSVEINTLNAFYPEIKNECIKRGYKT